VDGLDDLGVVDALQVDRRDAEVAASIQKRVLSRTAVPTRLRAGRSVLHLLGLAQGVHRLVVAVVHVQRRHDAAPGALLDEREPPVTGVPVDMDVDEVVDEPQRPGSLGLYEGSRDGSFP
jgi:hypothetical protein